MAASERKHLSERRFRELVAEALDGLPPEFGELLDNVAVVVEDEPSENDLREVGMDAGDGDELLGLYHGTPLDARGFEYGGLPDRVVIYRGPISRIARTRREVVEQVRETVLHELGHHFGLEEEDLPF
jgi:predicted Zn-dependent protease with MMP-like domain